MELGGLLAAPVPHLRAVYGCATLLDTTLRQQRAG